MKLNTAPNAARSSNPIAPMKPLQVKTGVRAGLSGRIRRENGLCSNASADQTGG
jgi:hypothetical protein